MKCVLGRQDLVGEFSCSMRAAVQDVRLQRAPLERRVRQLTYLHTGSQWRVVGRHPACELGRRHTRACLS